MFGLTWFRPSHDASICALVHLAGEEESVPPEPTSHRKLKAFCFVAVQEIITEPCVRA